MKTISALLWTLMAYLWLKTSGDFWTQLRTLSWVSVTATVTGNSLQVVQAPAGPGRTMTGKVSFSYESNGSRRDGEDWVSQRYDFGNRDQKLKDYLASFALGAKHTAYLSPDGKRVSLGHFPRGYSFTYAWCGMLALLTAFFCWFGVWKKDKNRRG